MLVSGDVFLWHKDTDLLKIIPGLPELTDRLTGGDDGNSSPNGTLEEQHSLQLGDRWMVNNTLRVYPFVV